MGGERLIIVAGPCMLESRELGMQVAERLRNECDRRGFGYVFKASFDKANRTSIAGKRGPGLELGLKWLAEIKGRMEVPILTDIHEPYQATPAAEVADILQIPAFLCRQTDLLVSAAATGRPLNVKKAQFLAPEDMGPVVEKCRAAGASEVILCERGTMLGYHQLVVDFSSLAVMRSFGCPVMFDATHSVQMPGGLGNATGGDRRRILSLIRAALAVGVDSLFMEIHPDPDHAQSDGPNMIPLDKVGGLFDQIERLDEVIRRDLGFAGLDWLDRM